MCGGAVRNLGRWDVGDAELDSFVESSVISFAAWDLITYFNGNQRESLALPELAALLARQEADMEPALLRLCETGVVVQRAGSEGVTFGLTEDPAVRDVVARFVALSAKREYRLELVRRVLGQITGG
jgi:hypothetical protein